MDRAGDLRRQAAAAEHENIEEVVRVLLPVVASRGEYTVACAVGCNSCCTNFIPTSFAEAELRRARARDPSHARGDGGA